MPSDDMGKPAAPTIALDAASDTGISQTDGITNLSSVTLTGSATAGDEVTIFGDLTGDGVYRAGDPIYGQVTVPSGQDSYQKTVDIDRLTSTGVDGAYPAYQYRVSAFQTDPVTSENSDSAAPFTITQDQQIPFISPNSVEVAADGPPATVQFNFIYIESQIPLAPVTVVVGSLPTNGTLTLRDGTPVEVGVGIPGDRFFDQVRFTPDPSEHDTTSSFSFTYSDEAGNSVGNQTDSISVGSLSQGATQIFLNVDPGVSYDGNGRFTITGQTGSLEGVDASKALAVVDGSDVQYIGQLDLSGDGTYSFTDDVGAHTQSYIVLSVADHVNAQIETQTPFDLTAGITGKPYVARQDRYDTSGNFTGQTFFKENGDVFFNDEYIDNQDGTVDYQYSGGTFFGNRRFSAYTDHYATDGTLLTVTRDRNDGGHLVAAVSPGQTLSSIGRDVLNANGQADTHFVFTPGYGNDTILGFALSGPDHDSITLPATDFKDLASVLRATNNTSDGVSITDPTSGDTVDVVGVTKAQLLHHRDIFDLQH